MPAPRPADGRRLLVLGVVLVGLNLRLAVTDVPPLLHELGHQLGMSSALQTVLTTIPVACFGLASPVAARMGRRLGDERAVFVGILATGAGQVLRVVAPGAFLLGTALAGVGITVLNVLLSSLIKRRAPELAATLLAAYLAALYAGAFVGSVVAVPLYRAAGGSLGVALGVEVVPALLAAAVWVAQLRHPPVHEPGTPLVPLARSAVAWAVTAFMGLQSLTFYASVSFLPDLYRSRGLDATTAGVVDGVLSVGGAVTAIAAPVWVRRRGGARPLLVATVVVGTAATAATLVLPAGAAIAVGLVLGLSQGVTIALALWFIIARAADAAVAGALSGMAQGVGYLVATAGPLSFGLLHAATGGWALPVGLLSVLTALTGVPALVAARPVLVGSGRPPDVPMEGGRPVSWGRAREVREQA